MSVQRFHPLVAGARIEGDWFDGVVPDNVTAGTNTVFDSTNCFKNYFSKKEVGLKVGNDVTFWRTSLAVDEEGTLEVGDLCYIANASIVANNRITIGSRCFIAGAVTITDSEFHPVSPAARVADLIAISPRGQRSHKVQLGSKPVTIGDDVWIGWHAVILKGVTVGDGAVIAPGSLVLKDVPAGAYVAGNPASVQEIPANE